MLLITILPSFHATDSRPGFADSLPARGRRRRLPGGDLRDRGQGEVVLREEGESR